MVKRLLIVLLNVGTIVWAAQGHALRKFELRAQSPQFWNLLDRQARLTRLGTRFGFTEARFGILTASFTSATEASTKFSAFIPTVIVRK